MEKLVSSWSSVKILPQDYIFPVGQRPGEDISAPVCKAIPVIDLGKASHERLGMIQQIINADEDFGFFQVINHGVSGVLMDETMSVVQEFFNMANEKKAGLFTDDPTKSSKFHTSSTNYATVETHYWRGFLSHPLEDFIHLWPETPTTYRDIVGKYSVEVRNLSLRIVDLISEGLRLITLLLQGNVNGLQVYKDGQWLGVEPLSDAFVVNIGYQLQVVSNDMFKGAEHRAVTKLREARTTIASFMGPCNNCIIEPAKALTSEGNPPQYKSFQYQEFLRSYVAKAG